MQEVHQVSSAEITRLKQYYTSSLTSTPPGAVFRAKKMERLSQLTGQVK
jgi:hypothetical protein